MRLSLSLVLLAVIVSAMLISGCGPRSVTITDRTKARAAGKTVPPTPPPQVTASDSETTSDIVHITRTGKRYHRADCRHLSASDIPIERDAAERKGYTPCHVCKP